MAYYDLTLEQLIKGVLALLLDFLQLYAQQQAEKELAAIGDELDTLYEKFEKDHREKKSSTKAKGIWMVGCSENCDLATLE
ncbi:hypothetical protein E2562_022253 [Oryza meyeriana var. granulata]|uniref:Rx N-terminal domain-containing protein n=1 Tax=Oryza meyeriana var. granulata TaxID=110450 RepID=A0A6G1ENX6_9ORYZ|nr:hypothetical protein E2562_022253 [Oryza meyeriana var. granulata]